MNAYLRAAHGGVDLAVRGDLSTRLGLRAALDQVNRRLTGERCGLLIGGPPCQGFSTAGACRLDDDRNRLLLAFIEAAAVLRPRHLILENVLGLWFRGRTLLDQSIEQLESQGYCVEVQVLHAEAYGVPQRRRRLIVQASLEGRPTWPHPWRLTQDPAYRKLQTTHAEPPAPTAFTVDDAIGDLPLSSAPHTDCPVAYTRGAPSELAAWLRGDAELADLLSGGAATTISALALAA